MFGERAMKTIRVVVLLLAGCSGAQPAANRSDPAPVQAPAAAPVPTPAPSPSEASAVEKKTADFSFSYRYPAAAARIPVLAASLNREREALRRATAKESAQDRVAARQAGNPFRPHEATVAWQVVTDTPRFLSLSAKVYGYTGGAHGSPGFAALVWDKQAGVRRKPTDLFDTAALERTGADAYCRAIDAERHKRRPYPIDASTDDPFSKCPKVSEGTLILGSSDRQRFDKLGFLIDPYVAGPFAEGTYEVTLPVTPAILRAVKPKYRDAFRAR
jgi:hypothetical protein